MHRFIFFPLLVAISSVAAAASEPHLPTSPADTLDGTEQGYPVVLTPTRLKQSLQDVPASVTIISSETIRKFGVTSIPDALRLVPGMAITQTSGSDYRVNYHGTNVLVPRRMNVLIDGVSVYQPAYARVDWKNLSVTIDDVDRIEVTRGPNSAAYGPNSMMAIINIITRGPKDVERAFISTLVGSQDTTGVTGRFAAVLGTTSLRLTASKERDSGYDFLSRIGGGHDSTQLDRLNVRSHTPLTPTTTLNLDAAYVQGTKEVPFVESYQTSFPDQQVRDYFLSASLNTAISSQHEMQIRASHWSNKVGQSWASCTPAALFLPEMFNLWQANPSYANAIIARRVPTGGSAADDALAARALQAIAALGPGGATSPICVTPNQDLTESRTDLELQDTYVFSDHLRFVGGLGVREQRGSSSTFFGTPSANTIGRIFANAEIKPSEQLTLNLGAYVERDELTGTSASPRLGAAFHLSNSQTARFVWSTGTRTPDVLEQRANWTYTLSDASPTVNGSSNVRFFQSARSPGGLSSERIESVELGYLLSVPNYGLMFDAKVFHDHLSDLISEKLQVASFMPTNNNSVRLTGLELQSNFELSSDWTAFANYTYLDNQNATLETERSQYSRHSGGLGMWHSLGQGWSMSLAYYGASADGPGQSHFGRQDATLSKAFRLGSSQARLALIARRLDNKEPTYFRDQGRYPQSKYDNRLQVFGQLQISL